MIGQTGKSIFRGKRVLVTGGSGFLGKHVVRELKRVGCKESNIIVPRSKDSDLRLKSACRRITKNIDVVIHLAGNVGGIGKNSEMPATLFYDNAVMGIELMEAARVNKVEKFVCVGTICAYPKYTVVPFKEEDLWKGYPEETNAPYGLAKKMLLVQTQSYRKQFGVNNIYLLPVNMYGPGDNFDPGSSHVIPSLIKKIAEAKINKADYIEVWGDGTPTREFLYIEDAARGVVMAAQYYNKGEPVNIGSGVEISIKNLVKMIAEQMSFKGRIIWDKNKPNGQPRRLLDVTRAKKEFGFKARVSFNSGLKKTIDWYLKQK